MKYQIFLYRFDITNFNTETIAEIIEKYPNLAKRFMNKIKNYGDEWIVGNQKIDGMLSIGGAADTNYKLKIIYIKLKKIIFDSNSDNSAQQGNYRLFWQIAFLKYHRYILLFAFPVTE